MAAPGATIARTDLEGLTLVARGKVRDLYRADDRLLLVATDRVSAFDVVFPTPIPAKGRVLTQLSAFWFRALAGEAPNHFLSVDAADLPAAAQPHRDLLAGRTMICRPAERIDIECVARGYLTGSAWAEYAREGTIHGQPFPRGLRQNHKFDAPIFTPTTKAESGHDLPLTYAELEARVGGATAAALRDTTVRLYRAASAVAAERGILIADTKLEFGRIDGALTWIDEAFTPDSSRFWAKEDYALDAAIPNFDKQYLRDYLTASGWNREPPPPALPEEVVRTTSARYQEIWRRLTENS